MTVYPVPYKFKDKRDYNLYNNDPDSHPVFKWLLKSTLNVVNVEDCIDDNYRDMLEISFKTKKDAETFAHHFGIDDKIKRVKFEDEVNPWLPDGMSYDDCMKIYGDIPGARG